MIGRLPEFRILICDQCEGSLTRTSSLRRLAARRSMNQSTPLSIPSFFYQMTPKISLNTRCSINISENLSINGRTRSSGQFGICSYNINP